ncbi:MAG: exodeoxyribonuclease VII large subunit, partial [Atribacterota bacterium]
MHPSECMTLFELTSQIREVIGMGFPSTIWVTAEIASIRTNQSGHCYLDLVEKNDDRVVAQAKAIIWVYHYRSLLQAFENATGETLKKDLKVLFQVEVSYHPVYGLSLNILDIDPTYSLGEMARKKRETLDRLVREGLIDLNKQLSLALVPQRVAIISSPQAAGYGDFITHLQNNPWGYQFSLHLFPALVQGEGAAIYISQALRQVRRKYEFFDIAVIVRGGGSQVDLSCFDDYQIAREIACLPLPVITGIGHERDDSVADRVAHTRMK